MFKCEQCEYTFSRKDILTRHLKRHNKIEQFKCVICGNLFCRKDALRRHEKSVHGMLKINEQPTATVVPAELPVTISKRVHIDTQVGTKKAKLAESVAETLLSESNSDNIIYEDSDDELCVKLLDMAENNDLYKNDNNIMYEDSDDELCVKLLEETEANELSNAKQQDMIEVANDIFVENIPAGPSTQSKRVHIDTQVGAKKAKLPESAAETSLLESKLFKIHNKKNRFIKKYNAYMINYSITLKPVPGSLDMVSLNALLEDGLENMISNIK